jgi:hypothetical protein
MWSVTGVLSFLNLLLIVHLIIHGDAENTTKRSVEDGGGYALHSRDLEVCIMIYAGGLI